MFDLVIKPFKSNGVLYERGTVITDPSLIRRYILKIREGKILQVNLEDEILNYKFNILVQRYHLDENQILIDAGILEQPSFQVEESAYDSIEEVNAVEEIAEESTEEVTEESTEEVNAVEEVDYESMTPGQKSAYTKRMKKLAALAEKENISE